MISGPESRNKIVLAFRHLAFEDLGAFADVFANRDYTIEYRDMGVDQVSTDEAMAADILIILGGPISVNDVGMFPFLADECTVIAERLKAKQPTLGICLGAQLMAQALGASVYAASKPEIGLVPIILTHAGENAATRYFKTIKILHWHGETFDLPLGALRLASTDICSNQAFSLGPNIMGLQFHPEAGPDGFERWLIGHHVELMKHGIDIGVFRQAYAAAQAALAQAAKNFLNAWLDGLVTKSIDPI